MPMPKTTVYDNHWPVFGQHDIRLAGQFLDMNAVTEALGKKRPPDQKLRAGILAADPAHDCTSLFLTENVGHDILS